MPRLPETLLTELKGNANPMEVAKALGLHFIRKGEDAYLARCPFHPDKTASLSLSSSKGLWHCLSCHEKGNLFQLVEKLKQVPFREAVAMVAQLSQHKPHSQELQRSLTPSPETPAAHLLGFSLYRFYT